MSSKSQEGKPAKFVSPRTVALYGTLAALTAAVTYASYTPFSPTKGYFNLGDSMVFFSAFAFGWRAGMICGGFGSAAADVLLGSGLYAPITLVAKGAEGFVAAILGKQTARKGWIVVLGIFVGTLGAVLSLQFGWPDPWDDIEQWTTQLVILLVCMVAVYALAFAYKEQFLRWSPTILAVAVGGTCMIATYFLCEYYLLNVGLGAAMAEIPINVAQVGLGGTIGALLTYYIRKSYRPIAAQ
jgi:uncharacterized membrane protein